MVFKRRWGGGGMSGVWLHLASFTIRFIDGVRLPRKRRLSLSLDFFEVGVW